MAIDRDAPPDPVHQIAEGGDVFGAIECARRACEFASEWLGPRTEQELREASGSEASQKRWNWINSFAD
jgi:hypothetical protein